MFNVTPELEDLIVSYIEADTKDVNVPDFDGITKEWYYIGNAGVMKSGIEKEYTDLQIAEYYKCLHDPVYFIEKYVWIISIDEGLIRFKLYPFQKKLIKSFQDNRFNIALQSRQTGKTTTSAAFILWYTIFHPDKLSGILANKADQAREIVSRIVLMLENIPFFLQSGCKELNKGSMLFDNNSRIISAASSSSSIRGKSLSLLYLDEFAFVPNDVQFYESTYPVITSGKKSRVIITSTPNGAKGMFYKLWQESKEDLNDFVRSKVLWYDVPDRDQEWAKKTKRNIGGEDQWRQEFMCDFLGSSGTLISMNVLDQIPVKKPIHSNETFNVYEEPIEGHEYCITVDTSHGMGLDYSAFIVFDITEIPYKVVARYKDNKISSLLYPSIISPVSETYNNAYILVEINDVGIQVANILYYDLEVETLLFVVNNGRSGQQIDSGFSPNAKVGLKQSPATKSIGCATTKTMVENHKIVINDHDIILELGTFVSRGKSYEADDQCNDDLAMCLVLFSWLTAQQYFKDLTNTDARQRLQEEHQELMYEELAPVGFIPHTQNDKEFVDDDGERWEIVDSPNWL